MLYEEIVIPEWNVGKTYAHVEVKDWKQFSALLEVRFLDWSEYNYRGQNDSSWPLRTKFDRFYREAQSKIDEFDPYERLSDLDKNLIQTRVSHINMDSRPNVLNKLLLNFKRLCTGRRGINPQSLSSAQWWALGQHYGLATPLLDWSNSPYVATFFALEGIAEPKSGKHAVWVFSHCALDEIFINRTKESDAGDHELPSIKIHHEITDENQRIISQNGLFSEVSNGLDIEEYIEKYIPLTGMSPVLYKIEIPHKLREEFLRHLDIMNINHASLYPDLIGSASAANRLLEKEFTDNIWQSTPDYVRRMLSDDASHD
ncbi:FRG domain-containing protein [Vibrio cyclitrophicus]